MLFLFVTSQLILFHLKFIVYMRELRAIGNNINQIARRANTLNNIDCELYKTEAIKWNNFMLDIKKEFLLPKEIK